ncbi:DUF29 domain-containing protein [Erwinia mallotivora]|uniref:DUF29 domain-containing protein n=1 Tax=Erwinia mallotivora TaxID=69222 RepID=UPI0035EC1FEF
MPGAGDIHGTGYKGEHRPCKLPERRSRDARPVRALRSEQRRKIERRLKKSPSIKHKLPEIVDDAYGDAVIAAERETNIRRSVFPTACPWTFEQVMDAEFWPE